MQHERPSKNHPTNHRPSKRQVLLQNNPQQQKLQKVQIRQNPPRNHPNQPFPNFTLGWGIQQNIDLRGKCKSCAKCLELYDAFDRVVYGAGRGKK